MKNYSAKEIKNIVLHRRPRLRENHPRRSDGLRGEGHRPQGQPSKRTTRCRTTPTSSTNTNARSIPTILFTEFMERKLNIIDCPGSDDFCGSLFSAFKVGDVGVMVFNAQNGWEVGIGDSGALFARTVQKPARSASSTSSTPRRPTSRGRSSSIRAASRVKPVIVQYPVNQGPGFNAFIDVLLMKLYRFKDENGTREELEIPAEEMERGHGAEPRTGGDGRRERRGAHGALFRQGHAHAGRHPFGSENRSLAARSDADRSAPAASATSERSG